MKSLILILCLFLAACVQGGIRSNGSSLHAYDGISARYPGDSRALAEAAAAETANRFPPGQTRLSLVKTDTSFGNDFETALRGRGFIMGGGMEIAYTLDEIRDEAVPTCYLQIRTSDGGSFGLVRPLTHFSGSAAAETIAPLPFAAPFSSTDSSSVRELPLAPASLPEPASAAEHGVVPAVSSAPAKPGKAAVLGSAAGPVPLYKVRTKATAEQVAQRNKIDVDDFCRWNNVSPLTFLPAGYKIHLKDPSPDPEPSSSQAPDPVRAVPLPLPLPFAPAPEPQSAPLIVPVHQDGDWVITPGKLHPQLTAWASRASYQLVWRSRNDFNMESHAAFRGSFVKALQDLFGGMHKRGIALRVTIFQGNQVVEVAEE